MANPIPPPLTNQSTEAILAAWAGFAKAHESGSCYYHNKSDLLYRLTQLQNDPKFYKHFFGMTKLLVIDVEAQPLEDEAEWNMALLPAIKNRREPYLIMVLGLDRLLMRGDTWVFHLLMKKEMELTNATFILFFTVDMLHPQFLPVFETASTWIRKTVFIPLHSPEDTKQYLLHQAAMWKMKLSDSQLNLIVNACRGGYFLLPKEALRFLRDNPKAKEEQIIHHREMDLRLESIWKQLLPSEWEATKKINKNIPITDPVEFHSLEFLKKTGWVNKNNVGAIPLLNSFLNKQSKPVHLVAVANRILYQGVPIEGNFTKTESILLTYLLQHEQKIVTREEISALLVKSDDEVYSDWAIDQIISRIRKKLAHLTISPNIIKTVRGKGFIFISKY